MKMVRMPMLFIVFAILPVFIAGHSWSAEKYPQEGLRTGKDPLPSQMVNDQIVIISEYDLDVSECIHKCLQRNQMVSMGSEVIEKRCRQACAFEKAMSLSRSSEKKARADGIRKLCASGDKRAVKPLIQALRRDFKERTGLWAWIIPALAKFGDSAAVPVLIEGLEIEDEYWLGREAAARALGRIRDPAAVPALVDASWRGDTRSAAIEALAAFRDVRTIPVLVSALDPGENRETREAAINGLHRLGKLAIPALIEAFSEFGPEHPEKQKRLWLCRLLGESGDERAIQKLKESLNDPDAAVRKCAAGYTRSK